MKIRHCPTCKRQLPSGPGDNPFGAFCSSRCRLIDLGAWLDGRHRISSPVSEEDLDQGMTDEGEGESTSESTSTSTSRNRSGSGSTRETN